MEELTKEEIKCLYNFLEFMEQEDLLDVSEINMRDDYEFCEKVNNAWKALNIRHKLKLD